MSIIVTFLNNNTAFYYLERNFNLWIPGFSSDELKPYKKSFATEAHKQVNYF